MTIQEALARISYDVGRLEEIGVKKSNITVLLTRTMYYELVMAAGYSMIPPDITICGCALRIVSGRGMEWFISVSHGVVQETCGDPLVRKERP